MTHNHPILSAVDLTKTYQVSTGTHGRRRLTALDRVSLQLGSGETVGIAGESGCGKSTLAKVLAGLLMADSGTVFYKGTPVAELNSVEARLFRRSTQMIFQDPFSSLNPRMRIGDSIREPLIIAGLPPEIQQRELERHMAAVGLPMDASNRFPDEFSGGQRQRIGIARALAASPSILIADEPVSSLDISIQAQIINILLEMKREFTLSMVIVSHNLLVLRHLCDRIIIMYLGTIVESGPAEKLFQSCRHPYTEALIAAIPGIHTAMSGGRELLQDDIPSPLDLPSGCRFHPRCRHAAHICRTTPPVLTEYPGHHSTACHRSEELYGVR